MYSSTEFAGPQINRAARAPAGGRFISPRPPGRRILALIKKVPPRQACLDINEAIREVIAQSRRKFRRMRAAGFTILPAASRNSTAVDRAAARHWLIDHHRKCPQGRKGQNPCGSARPGRMQRKLILPSKSGRWPFAKWTRTAELARLPVDNNRGQRTFCSGRSGTVTSEYEPMRRNLLRTAAASAGLSVVSGAAANAGISCAATREGSRTTF
jgi:hypothetical protein